jgi:hypothetical protein
VEVLVYFVIITVSSVHVSETRLSGIVQRQTFSHNTIPRLWPGLESYKAYIGLDKPAVRDANDTVMNKQSQCEIRQAGNERRMLKRGHLCEHV